jgi:hypothetical protein
MDSYGYFVTIPFFISFFAPVVGTVAIIANLQFADTGDYSKTLRRKLDWFTTEAEGPLTASELYNAASQEEMKNAGDFFTAVGAPINSERDTKRLGFTEKGKFRRATITEASLHAFGGADNHGEPVAQLTDDSDGGVSPGVTVKEKSEGCVLQ